MTRNGFTLVEMTVALLIFGMLASAGVALLSVSVRAQEAADTKLDEAASMRRATALLAGDLANAAPRLHRDEQGATRPAFTAGEGEVVLSLVRRGWENAEGEDRSSLQRIDYRLTGGTLRRDAYPHVDGARPDRSAILLSGVRTVTIRARANNGQWREIWDPANPSELPRAVELTFDTEKYGQLRQVLLVGAAG